MEWLLLVAAVGLGCFAMFSYYDAHPYPHIQWYGWVAIAGALILFYIWFWNIVE